MGCCGSKAGPLPKDPSVRKGAGDTPLARRSLLQRVSAYKQTVETPQVLASCTHFSVQEVCALQELFKRVSNSIIKDGQIHRQEFHLALFKREPNEGFFANRVFDIFDAKKNGVIEFGEFVRALSVFHPASTIEEKANFAFRLYDLQGTGYIDKQELTQLLIKMLNDNPDLKLPEEAIVRLVEETFEEADLGKDGRIWPNEWLAYVHKYPTVVSFMTLPILRNLTKEFPSFAFNSNLDASLETQIQDQMDRREKAKQSPVKDSQGALLSGQQKSSGDRRR